MKTKMNSKEHILQFFLLNPTRSIHLRALSRELGLSPAGILKASRELIAEKIIILTKDKEKNLTLLHANRDSPSFFFLKKTRNIYSIYSSGLLHNLIEQYGKPEAVVLFGSYARGEDTEQSDIDIAILTKKHIPLNLNLFEKKLSRKIKLTELSKEKIEKEFWFTLINGIVLSGYLEPPL